MADHARLYVDNAGSPVDAAARVKSYHVERLSITGILSGAAIGSSMGLSPQSGLPHNNRVEDLDNDRAHDAANGLSFDEVENALCSEGKLKGLSGGHNDIRDISPRLMPEMRMQLARCVVHSARHWIGAYFAQLNGLDALVFTAGARKMTSAAAICANLEQLGIRLDPEKRGDQAEEAVIAPRIHP